MPTTLPDLVELLTDSSKFKVLEYNNTKSLLIKNVTDAEIEALLQLKFSKPIPFDVTSPEQYIQQTKISVRTHKIIELLNSTIQGYTLDELAAELNESKDNCKSILNILIEDGIVEQRQNKYYGVPFEKRINSLIIK